MGRGNAVNVFNTLDNARRLSTAWLQPGVLTSESRCEITAKVHGLGSMLLWQWAVHYRLREIQDQTNMIMLRPKKKSLA